MLDDLDNGDYRVSSYMSRRGANDRLRMKDRIPCRKSTDAD
jgi:hypothetical protein